MNNPTLQGAVKCASEMVDSTSPETSKDVNPSPDSTSQAQAKPESASMQDSQTKQSQIPQRSAPQNPGRQVITGPSPSALQRALQSQRQTASLDGVLEGTKDRTTHGTNSPSWPTSPRLKSPPPNPSRTNGVKKEAAEHVQSNTAKRLATISAPELAAALLLTDGASESTQPRSSSHLRVPARGIGTPNTGLETVVEGSVPTTPSIEPKADPIHSSQLDSDSKADSSATANSSNKDPDTKMEAPSARNTFVKADSDTQIARAPSTSRPPGAANLAKRSITSLTGNKKIATDPLRTMTVETEQVSATTPGLGDRARDSGSVRTKTSTETIRPKKEKKKPTRKPTSLAPGGVTSKADLFEAKVASAVDEADTSDSDETFVYESNPPENRVSHRHHSRTPSATSLASTHDHYRGNKSRNGSSAIPGKKSMKFSNSIHTREYDDDPNRSSTRTVSSTPRHHHIGRYGRNNHLSVFNEESPFSQARQPHSPRNVVGNQVNGPHASNRLTSPRKYGGHAYDNNEDAADDERMPLVGTVRVKPGRHNRRPHSRDFRTVEFGEDIEPRCWSRVSAYSLLVFLFLLICSGVAAFVVAVNQPLYDVEIRRIQSVLASEQELMLDLDVRAINPNLFAVTVTDLDVNLFAESPYAGTTGEWYRQHPQSGLRLSISNRRMKPRSWFWPDPPPHTDDGVDEGTDPDDPTGIQKLLLGGVSEFDSPLTFDPAPIRRNPTSSVGEIRLARPGNKTEVGGSARWEKVILHDFDLIVRGVIKYQLPFSSKTRTAKVAGRRTVHPTGEDLGHV